MPGSATKNGHRAVHPYCECHRLDAPAVLGWFRPVVLLPVRALTGLTEAQIEAVIAHELAHIRRLDCFVNLFQIATETLLFYHPAVWWVSQRIRAEREELLRRRSDRDLRRRRQLRASAYADGRMADGTGFDDGGQSQPAWRARDAAARMEWEPPVEIRVAGLAGSFVCLVGALLAANGSWAWRTPRGQRRSWETGARKQQRDCGYAGACFRKGTRRASRETSARCPTRTETATEPGQRTADRNDGKKQSYMDAMAAAGVKITDVDELISLKIQGVTPRIHQGDARSWIAAQRGRTHRDESTGHHPGIRSRDAEV